MSLMPGRHQRKEIVPQESAQRKAARPGICRVLLPFTLSLGCASGVIATPVQDVTQDVHLFITWALMG